MSDWPIGPGSPFDDIFERFFGPSGPRRAPVQRVDLSRLLTESAKSLLAEAVDEAAERGNSEVTPEHVLLAAATSPEGRSILTDAGLSPRRSPTRSGAGSTACPPGTTHPAWARACAWPSRSPSSMRPAPGRTTSAPSPSSSASPRTPTTRPPAS